MTDGISNWKNYRIGDFVKVISGYAFKSKDFKSSGIPVIKIKNIKNGYVDLEDTQFIDEGFLSLNEKFHVKKGDLLISLTGSHLTQPNSVVGRVAICRAIGRTGLLNQRAGKILVNAFDSCDPVFLFYALTNREKAIEIAQLASGAANQANISPSQVESLEICFPPLLTQQKIASILSAYDDLIENNARRISILEEMAQMIYREWFVKFRFPGHEKVKMVDSPLGKIPEEWEVKTLMDLINIQKGKKAKTILNNPASGTVPYLLIDGMKSGKCLYTDDKKFVMAKKNDILMVMDGASSSDVYTNVDGAVGSTLAYIRLKEKSGVSTLALYLFFKHNYPELKSNNTGSAIPHANKDYILNMLFAVPTNWVSQNFHIIVSLIYEKIENLKNKNNLLHQTRDLLLPTLISGKLDVSDLDIEIPEIDEPELQASAGGMK